MNSLTSSSEALSIGSSPTLYDSPPHMQVPVNFFDSIAALVAQADTMPLKKLAIICYTLLKSPRFVDHSQAAASSFVRLAYKFITLERGSSAEIESLIEILGRQPTPGALAPILEERCTQDLEVIMPDSAYELWDSLVNCFKATQSLEKLDLEQACQNWIAACNIKAEDCVKTILLLFSTRIDDKSQCIEVAAGIIRTLQDDDRAAGYLRELAEYLEQ
ncbi:MAG: hypothetical protein JSR37_07590 [Verrucomicrobia bacterium]|nr:hypothetical protein [Verrucomicrobiota bacterium]MBS0637252.1 hypothetical protein [Verrucomicrobiota bacterium]